METATERQAEIINELTYKLYNLKGKRDTNIIMSYAKALELSYDVALEMIKDLRKEIKDVEVNKFLIKNLRHLEKTVKAKPIKLVENYIQLDKIEVDTSKKFAILTTIDNKTIKLEDTTKVKGEKGNIQAHSLFALLQRVIDYDIRVNLFKMDDENIVILEDEKMLKHLKEKVSLYNQILTTTDYLLALDKVGNIVADRVMPLIKERNTELFKTLSEKSELELGQIFNLFRYVANRNYGLVYQNDTVHLY